MRGVFTWRGPGRGHLWLWATAAVVASIAFSLHLQIVTNYFFLYDDFALIGQTSDLTWLQILNRPLFGFWRPLSFILQSGLSPMLGWTYPSGYAVGSLVLHFGISLIVARLASQLGLGHFAAVGAGLIAFLSPYATEAFYWLSAQFDLWSAFGVLLSTSSGLDYTRSTSRRPRLAFSFMLLGAVIAVSGKENGAILPLCFLVLATHRCSTRSTVRKDRVVRVVGVQALVTGLYLVWRSRLLPFGSGAYGNFTSLITNADLLDNVVSYANALALLPLPEGESMPGFATVAFARVPFLFVCLPALALACFQARAVHLALRLIAALFVSVLPVLWFGVAAPDGSRFVYLPGVFYALLLSTAWNSAWARAAGSSRIAVGLVAVLILANMTWSRAYQQSRWLLAFSVSSVALAHLHSGLEQADRAGGAKIFLRHLPDRFIHGPTIIKGYALQYVFGASDDRISGTSTTLLADEGACAKATATLSQVGSEVGAFLIDVGPAPGQTLRFSK